MDDSQVGLCTICHCQTTAIEWHHTVPQALGGKDSLQIPLCSDCHTTLHKKALAVFSVVAGQSKKVTKTFWLDPAAERNAEQFVVLIVNALLNPPDSTAKTYKMVVEVNTDLHEGLKLLKLDLKGIGISNLSQAILYCIKQTLQKKGLYHVTRQNSSSNQRTENKNSLWSMQRIGKR